MITTPLTWPDCGGRAASELAIQGSSSGPAELRQPRTSITGLSGPGSGSPDNVALFHDRQLFAVDLDLRARPFAEQHAVPFLHINRHQFAALVARAGADGIYRTRRNGDEWRGISELQENRDDNRQNEPRLDRPPHCELCEVRAHTPPLSRNLGQRVFGEWRVCPIRDKLVGMGISTTTLPAVIALWAPTWLSRLDRNHEGGKHQCGTDQHDCGGA
jgi:hypothetical protein